MLLLSEASDSMLHIIGGKYHIIRSTRLKLNLKKIRTAEIENKHLDLT